MAIAYFILAHKNKSQVERLFTALYHPDDLFVFHVDCRAAADLRHLPKMLGLKYSNVCHLKPRRIGWGGYSLVAAQLEAASLALSREHPWTHFVTLSGQDFPLKRRAEVLPFFDASRDRSFLSWFDPLTTHYWSNALQRVERWHLHSPTLASVLSLRFLGRRLRSFMGWQNQIPYVPGLKRKSPFFRYFGGANHVALNRDAVRYLTQNQEALSICRWLRHAAIPDEILFQSVLLNSPLSGALVNDDLREIDFPLGAASPNIWRLKDLEHLQRSPKFWARKFDEQVDSAVIEALERQLKSE